jgi:protein involved in polysaccharide export with SLBB domain
MWLTDLIPTAVHLLPGADANYVLIRRERGSDRRVSAISADLAAALRAPRSAADIRLESRDTIHVFSLAFGRQRIIAPILEELELQARSGAAFQAVIVGGRVRAPGAYPLEEGMRVSDLIRAGGQLEEAAYLLEAELTRYDMHTGQYRETELITIELSRVLAGDTSADLLLAAHDVLNIKEIPLWRELEVIEIKGEVQFPGKYPIRRGEHISSVLARAGGLTDMAFAEGAIFLREDLREREQEQLRELAERLENEVEAAASGQTGDAESAGARRALLQQLRTTQATGRLVIDLPWILAAGANTEADVVLQNGDQLLIPRRSQTVTIIGEVQFPTSHIFEPNVGRDDYIERSGGFAFNADKKRIYVVRANGSVVADSGSRFFRGRGRDDIQPGDTIVVPLDADRMSRLTLWTNVSTILFNFAIAAAAVASF